MSNLYPSFSFNEDILPKNNGIIKEITSLISEYKNNLRYVDSDPNKLTESQEELIYLISRVIKKHLESRFMDRLLTDATKLEMRYELQHILNAVSQLNPIDNKLKWECIPDVYNGSVTLRAYIDE